MKAKKKNAYRICHVFVRVNITGELEADESEHT